MLRHGYDDVNGIVIGGNPAEKQYRIYYEDRRQHQFYSTRDSEAKEKAENYIKEQKQELGIILYNNIYPADAWELRIYDL